MKLARYEYIKSSMTVFSLGLLQDYVNISRQLKDYGITESELDEYVSDNKKIYAGEKAKMNMELGAAALYCRCPKCGDGINVETVNTSPRNVVEELDSNGDQYQSVATCKDERGCGWQKFSVKDVSKLLRTFFPSDVLLELEDMAVWPHGMTDPELQE